MARKQFSTLPLNIVAMVARGREIGARQAGGRSSINETGTITESLDDMTAF